MEKINKFTILIGLSFTLFFSCSTEEDVPPPLPEASFDVNTHYSDTLNVFLAEKTDEIIFINQSKNGQSVEWNFGDGTLSTEQNPKHQYDKNGQYQVKLLVKGLNNEVSIHEETVVIGSRIFSSIQLLKIDDQKINDQSWDLNDGPDIFLFFGEVGNPDNSYFLNFPDNLNNSDLPYGGDINLSWLYVNLSDKDWFWILVDNDDPIQEFDERDEYMFGATINPARLGSRDLVTGEGTFEINTGLDASGISTSKFALSIGWVFRIREN